MVVQSFLSIFILFFAIFAIIDGVYATIYGRGTSRGIGIFLLILGFCGAVFFSFLAQAEWESILEGLASVVGALAGFAVATGMLLLALIKS
jgi:inner membrane protein involved in colicin E2 resistance